MPTRADGKKKSLFLAQESVLSGAYFDYVASGTNYKISYEDFLAGLDISDKVEQGGLLSMQGNATATTMASIGVPVVIAGTWVSESANSMTASTSGRLTYNANAGRALSITAEITVSAATGAGQDISAYIAINGAVLAASRANAKNDDGVTVKNSAGTDFTIYAVTPISLSALWRHSFEIDDYVEVFIENATSTNNLVVSRAILRVN